MQQKFNIKLVFESVTIEIEHKSIENFETIVRGIIPKERTLNYKVSECL